MYKKWNTPGHFNLVFFSLIFTNISTFEHCRSYLVGSTNTGLLGSEELIRYFPNKRIRIHVCTWNVAETKTIPVNVDNLLLPKISEILFDMYVISTQETAFDRQEWSIKLQETLGPHFVMYCQAAHGTLNIVVFIRRDLIWFLSAPEESTVTTRMGPSSIKTKGAVAVSFILFGSPMVFINSHFKAHEGKHEDRVEDYKKIVTNLYFPKTVGQKQVKNNEPVDSTSLFDHVFWMGDLNSRMEIERSKIGGAMMSGELGLDQIEKLLEMDELKRIVSEQLAFKDFSEARIKFLPTYKFDIGTDNYDTSNKNRVPSYTDRILYRCKKKSTISCLHYDSVGTFMQSDHKPVYGVYEAELRPGLDDVMFSGGQFNRQIWIEGSSQAFINQLINHSFIQSFIQSINQSII
ncbi:hypothetical protein HELRODRAFT_82107 [Helobdella robusta]|uniref:Inositol polyphosphate-related phosphatase domain-containing protein n=1 Tax=Helobdella robusta TaxID=6412 RepID=T1G4M9_HELRO|nr:hypothetical protein HELRODRAFT_82107 [Helobdella robusta]ESO01361.1 hypothetical protein HELRODRAFT_82107 [Helobdella robusta]